MILEQTSADLGALRVEHDGTVLVGALLESLPEVVERVAVRLKC